MRQSRRIIITGATGLVGRALAAELMGRGDDVVVFARNVDAARKQVPGAAEYVQWDGKEQGAWANAVPGAYAIVHLAGASLFGKRWTDAYKQEIRDSRILSTRGLVNAMERAAVRPNVFVSGSAVGYYGFRDDTPLTEDAPAGDDFLAQVCVDWEAEARRAETLRVRTVLLRTGIVLDKDEGALPQMMLPFKFFVGGPILPGTQWFSWVHLRDEIGLILRAIDDTRISGPLNAVAPEAQTNADFVKTLGAVMNRPAVVPVPGFALKLMVGEFAEALTNGQHVVPAKAQAHGYRFAFPTAEAALRDLLGE